MRSLGSTVLTLALAFAFAFGGGCAIPVVTVPTGPVPDCATACQPFASCRPDDPGLTSECLASCSAAEPDPEARRTLASLSCAELDALIAAGGGAPEVETVSEPEPEAPPSRVASRSGGSSSFHPEQTVGIEIAEVVVAPSRAGGTGWDGQRTLDGPRTEMLER